MKTALIACYDNWNTLSEVPSILNKGGFEVHALCDENSWLLKNKFYNKWIVAAKGADAYCAQLVNLVKSESYDWIIPGDEKIIKLLNEAIVDEDLFYKLLPLTKIENRELLSSKLGLANICGKYGVCTPGYIQHVIGEGEPDLQLLRFPMIIKIDFSWGGGDIKICRNASEINAILTQFPVGEKVIIQEYISGKEVPVEALFWRGDLVGITNSEILEYDKDEFSYSTRRKYFEVNEVLRKEAAYFGECAGIHGFVNMAYIKSADDGRYYLIEADTRPSSWSAYARFAGSSFSEALKCISSNKAAPLPGKFKSIDIALFHKDLRRGLYKHDWKGLLQWVYQVNWWKYIPFYDTRLLANTCKELWTEFVVDKWQRIKSRRNNTR
ncbi:MAG: hypothetical protein ACXVAY_14290 [Mucilaginibacter sp.]